MGADINLSMMVWIHGQSNPISGTRTSNTQLDIRNYRRESLEPLGGMTDELQHYSAATNRLTSDRCHQMKYAVVIITPSGYIHSQCFLEVAETIHYGLRSLGYDSILTTKTFIPGRRHIVLGSNLLPSLKLEIPPDSILYNLEQVKNNELWLNSDLISIFKMHSLWDYSADNALELKKFGVNVESLMPISYCAQLTRIKKSNTQDIDVLFVGSINQRRKEILSQMKKLGLNVVSLFGSYGSERDAYIGRSKILLNMHFYEAKILEVVRISYYLANQIPVLSEFSANAEDDKQWGHGLVFAEYQDLPRRAYELCTDDDLRAQIAIKGFNLIKERDIEPFLEKALQVNIAQKSNYNSEPGAKMRRNELCYCGSGKRYKHCHGSLGLMI